MDSIKVSCPNDRLTWPSPHLFSCPTRCCRLTGNVMSWLTLKFEECRFVRPGPFSTLHARPTFRRGVKGRAESQAPIESPRGPSVRKPTDWLPKEVIDGEIRTNSWCSQNPGRTIFSKSLRRVKLQLVGHKEELWRHQSVSNSKTITSQWTMDTRCAGSSVELLRRDSDRSIPENTSNRRHASVPHGRRPESAQRKTGDPLQEMERSRTSCCRRSWLDVIPVSIPAVPPPLFSLKCCEA